jgi:hypothetical protein
VVGSRFGPVGIDRTEPALGSRLGGGMPHRATHVINSENHIGARVDEGAHEVYVRSLPITRQDSLTSMLPTAAAAIRTANMQVSGMITLYGGRYWDRTSGLFGVKDRRAAVDVRSSAFCGL